MQIIADAGITSQQQRGPGDARVVGHGTVDDHSLPGRDQVALHRAVDGDDRAGRNDITLHGTVEGEIFGADVQVVLDHFVCGNDNCIATAAIESAGRACQGQHQQGKQGKDGQKFLRAFHGILLILI